MRRFTIFWFFCLLSSIRENLANDEIESRIISGESAVTGQFPWHVVLKKDASDDLLCGASIISETWVLTAAHCTYGLSSIYLMFGSIYLESSEYPAMTSTEIHIHPNFDSITLNNDISLIRLPQALVFSNFIQPVKLIKTTIDDSAAEGAQAVIVGFGLTDDEYLEYSQNLQFAYVEIINNDQCRTVFGENVVIDSTLCAKGFNSTNMSICSGDSGGSLTVQANDGQIYQIGVNSFVAQDMCTEGFPSGFARLTHFLDYIKDVTGIE